MHLLRPRLRRDQPDSNAALGFEDAETGVAFAVGSPHSGPVSGMALRPASEM